MRDKWEKANEANIASVQKKIDAIYKEAVREAAAIGVTIKDMKDKPFTFEQFPSTRKRVEKMMQQMGNRMEYVIASGIRASWDIANEKDDALVLRVFGSKAGKLTDAQKKRYFNNNSDALEAFIKRKTEGLDLSDRVWKYTDMFKEEIEMGLDLGIREGRSAQEMSRDLRSYLQYPDKLFRRIRDEHGNLQLSKAAKTFHPGQGVYRSSYKNARRLAATETNMAYRTSDHERWQQFDFVVGIEVHLSNNHTCLGTDGKPHLFSDICDSLAGKYPKDFKFLGWHPHCRCFATSILKTPEELAADTQTILEGGTISDESSQSVYKMPDKFTAWCIDNAHRLETAKNLPYFVKDNKDWVEIAKIQGGAFSNPYENLGKQRKAVRQMVNAHTIRLHQFGADVDLSNKNIKEWLNQPHGKITEKNEALRYIDKILNSAEYMGNGPDEHGNGLMHLFETMIGGEKSWIVVRQYENGIIGLHSISDNPSILRFITKKDFGFYSPGTAIPIAKKPKSYSAAKVKQNTEPAKTKEQLLEEQRQKRREMILQRAKIRHEARTTEQVQAIKKFADDHKKKTDAIYDEIVKVTSAVKAYPTVDASKLRSLIMGKEGVTTMKSGEKALASIEKLKKELSIVKDELAKVTDPLKEFNARVANNGILYNEVKMFGTQPTEKEIIERLAGGDMTKGSCSSLAFAYAGNKAGLDVLDFRGGTSCATFSNSTNIFEIVGKSGGIITKGTNDFTKASELLKTVVDGKEYYFTCARHAAIVRKTAAGFEYLELQSGIQNGWKPLTTPELKRRFKGQRSHTSHGIKFETRDCIIDIELLAKNPGFKRMLGYINTNKDKQMKGAAGTIK